MKIKLDENLGKKIHECFAAEGLDAETVASEGLTGESDDTLYDFCSKERRTLVTMDRGFSNLTRFHPERLPGLVVLAPGKRIRPQVLLSLAKQVAKRLKAGPMRSMLWIVQPGRIREWPASSEEPFVRE